MPFKVIPRAFGYFSVRYSHLEFLTNLHLTSISGYLLCRIPPKNTGVNHKIFCGMGGLWYPQQLLHRKFCLFITFLVFHTAYKTFLELKFLLLVPSIFLASCMRSIQFRLLEPIYVYWSCGYQQR